MKFSPWPAVLIAVACAAYFFPPPTASTEANPQLWGHAANPPSLSGPLTEGSRALFAKSRPATVEIQQLGQDRYGSQVVGLGTGFLVSGSGQIMTAYHVVDGAKLLRVKTLSGELYRARVTAFDNAADVAMLQLESQAAKLPSLTLAERAPRIGENVLAIGNSGGDFLQARTGKLLRLGARAGNADFPQNTLEMSAPLAPGDSGGPILNAHGEVMGVVSYVRVNDEGRTITSYAVPVSTGSPLVQSLQVGEKRDVPALGLGFDSAHDGLTAPSGGVVAQVVAGSPAGRAGVRGPLLGPDGEFKGLGDVITAVDGVRTRRANDVIFEIRRRKVGDVVRLTLSNNGQTRQLDIPLVAKASIDYNQ